MIDKDGAFHCPKGWRVLKSWGTGWIVLQISGGLRVIVDVEEKMDGHPWIHVSASRSKWTPNHDDMTKIKHDFIGEDRYAYSVWPPSDMHVNIHKHCLHLWARLDGSRVLPEFSDVIDGVGRSI